MIINPSCFVIAVAGGKGGVGKSTFAVNLASAISTELKTQVLLMDADQNSAGDLQVLLGVRPVKNMNEIAQFSGALTPANFNTVLTMHPSGSIALIPAVKGPEESLQVSPDAILKQLEVFSRHFKYLVIDIGHQMTNLQKALLDEAKEMGRMRLEEVLRLF
jgi:septum site-determining protein MinD